MPRGLRTAACIGKFTFPTYEAAVAMANVAKKKSRGYKRDDSRMMPYRCPYCEGWHLGHESDTIRRGEPRRRRWHRRSHEKEE